MASVAACSTGERSSERAELSFVDVTAGAGLEEVGPTFAAALADLDRDGDEDLLVVRHGFGPRLFLNQLDASSPRGPAASPPEDEVSAPAAVRFRDATELLPRSRGDRHGVLVLDLDGDGDRDLAMACGGADGVGPGCPNRLFVSLLAERGELAFADASEALGEAAAAARRSRAFYPLVAEGGERLDLLLTAKPRPGFPSLHLRGSARAGELAFVVLPDSSLSGRLDSEGRDLVVDVDRDGAQDVVVVDGERLRLFGAAPGGYTERQVGLEVAKRVLSVAAGDVDGDALPDLLVGTHPPHSGSDHVLWRGDRLHFLVLAQERDAGEELSFEAGDVVELDLTFKGGKLEESTPLFLGAEALPAPPRRSVRREEAAGVAPAERQRRGGTYLGWSGERWHLSWRHEDAGAAVRGALVASDLRDVQVSGLEQRPAERTRDLLLLNRLATAGRFVEAGDEVRSALAHHRFTETLALADLDCDGNLDAIALRAGEQGAQNGGAVLLRNLGGGRLAAEGVAGPGRPEDDLFAADQLVVGFVDGDLRPDLFVTHGGGLRPGSLGPFRLYLNRTPGGGACVLLELVGAAPNREALGAQVELYDGGERLGYREAGAGIQRSQSSTLVHFGAGARTGPLRARIRWPRGQVSEHPVAVGERQVIAEPR